MALTHVAMTGCRLKGPWKLAGIVVAFFTGIVFGDNAVSFDRRAGVARVANLDADAMRSFPRTRALGRRNGTFRAWPTTLLSAARYKSGKSAVAAATGSTTADEGAIAHLDQINSVFGAVTVRCNDNRNRLADDHLAAPIDRDRPALKQRLHAPTARLEVSAMTSAPVGAGGDAIRRSSRFASIALISRCACGRTQNRCLRRCRATCRGGGGISCTPGKKHHICKSRYGGAEPSPLLTYPDGGVLFCPRSLAMVPDRKSPECRGSL